MLGCCQIEMDEIYFQKRNHPSPNNRLPVISKNYLVLSILFVNIKFIQRSMLILAGSTDHRARELPTHDTIVCPICGTIFFETDVFRLHPKKWPLASTEILFPQMLIYQNIVRKMTTSYRMKVLAPRVIPMKMIAIMKRRQMTKYHIYATKRF